MPSPNCRPGKTLNRFAVEVVRSFSDSDELSSAMPGMKRLCVS
jgi:hypothetical protein